MSCSCNSRAKNPVNLTRTSQPQTQFGQGGPGHVSQTPTFVPRCAIPCAPPPFIPNQPPVPPHGPGFCCEPPPPQKGPWEYTPSMLYPDTHHPSCCRIFNVPYFTPNQPQPMPCMPHHYECMPKQGRMPSPCINNIPDPPVIK